MAVDVWVTVADVAERLESAAVPPTAPVKIVVPDPPAIVKLCAPFSVLLKVMFLLLEVMTLVPVKLTGSGNIRLFAPDTVILLPTWMVFALVKVMFVKGFVPPMAPPNETTPAVPACKVSAKAPSSVLEKLMFAPAAVVVLKAVDALKVTGPVMPMVAPFVVILPLILMAEAPV